MNKIKILLAEDNPGDVDLTLEAFEAGKIANELYVVNDGQAVIDFLRKEGEYVDAERPDLILLDINMPILNGVEVLKIIKQDEDLKLIPVVMLTSSDQHGDILKSYGNHANCYVTKPVNFEKFADAIQKIETFWFTVVKLPTKE